MKLELAALLLKLFMWTKIELYPYITVKLVYFHLCVYKTLNLQHCTTNVYI